MIADWEPNIDANMGDLPVRPGKRSKTSKGKASSSGDQNHGEQDGTGGYTVTWLKRPLPNPLKPDGRKCSMCPRCDSHLDPVSLAMGIQEPMWWGHVPYPDGSTVGGDCGYCTRYHKSTAAKQGISITEYKKKLGASEAAIDEHMKKVDMAVDRFIEFQNRSAHIDFGEIETKVLEEVRQSERKIKRPGFTWEPWDFYMSGNDHRVKTQLGHYEGEFEGQRGVYMPDAPTVRIEFNDIEASQLRTRQADTGRVPEILEGQLEDTFRGSSSRLRSQFENPDTSAGSPPATESPASNRKPTPSPSTAGHRAASPDATTPDKQQPASSPSGVGGKTATEVKAAILVDPGAM